MMKKTILDSYVEAEKQRQQNNVELIASENFPSMRVRRFMESCLTAKYAEGYPEQSSIDEFCKNFPDFHYTGRVGRYYGGCKEIDQVELYCQYMFQQAFNTDYHVNVQPHSGSQANCSAYFAVLNPGDTILSMDLNDGGHLTHGSKVNFSGKSYNFVHYRLDANGLISYNDLLKKIIDYKPAMIVLGASAYPREIHFSEICELVDYACTVLNGAEGTYKPLIMADIAHVAGLVAAGKHESPFGLVDIVTTTTHKTLRGPRGGLIFCKQELANKIDSAVFPGTQGGPLLHVIAAKAACAEELLEPSYKEYIQKVVTNTSEMAKEFIRLGQEVVTDGTDNHLLLLNFVNKYPHVSGREVQERCDEIGITLNKNAVNNDPRSPKETSGVRIGCAPMTTKGYTAENFKVIAKIIHNIIEDIEYENARKEETT